MVHAENLEHAPLGILALETTHSSEKEVDGLHPDFVVRNERLDLFGRDALESS